MATSSDAPTQADHEAMMEIANWARSGTAKKFPSKLEKYLQAHDFKVTPPGSSAVHSVHPYPYEVAFFQKIIVQALPSGTEIPPDENLLRFYASFIKMIPRGPGPNGQAIQTFTTDNFVTIDLSNPAARVIVTVQLSGCSFVIGHDKHSKDLLHLGHAQPSTGGDASHSAELKQHFKTARLDSVFEGKELKKVEVIGGYGSTIAKVLGWVSAGKLFVTVKTPEKLAVVEFS